jgi:hypothetical protein
VPDTDEGFPEDVQHLVGVEVAGSLQDEAEVVDPKRRRSASGDLVGALVGDPYAHVLEDRQHVRERDRRIRAEQLAAQDACLRFQRLVETHPESASAGGLLRALDVGHR